MKKIITLLVLNLIGFSCYAQYGQKPYSNEYVSQKNNIKPSKNSIDKIKKEQEAINNGAILVIDNSEPGRWRYKTITKSSIDNKERENELIICLSQEMINESKLKNIAKMFIPVNYQVSCKSSFKEKDSSNGVFAVNCESVGGTSSSGKVLVDINGTVKSESKKSENDVKILFNFVNPDKGNENITVEHKIIGEKIGSCSTYDNLK